MPEGDISNVLSAIREPNQFRHERAASAPVGLNEIALLALKALFEKSEHPSYFIHNLSSYYGATHDFRLLQMTPEVLLGRRPDEVFSVLNDLHSGLVNQLKEEAAADELVVRIKQLRTKDRTETDRWALELYEMLVERQSAQIANQPGPHAEACLAALRRSGEHRWSDGEPLQLSNLLLTLGAMPTPELRDEQLRQLRALQSAVTANSREQLQIAAKLCQLLYRSYHRPDEALQTLEAAIHSYEQARKGELVSDDDGEFGQFVQMLADSGRYASAEQLLHKHLKKARTSIQKDWLTNRLWRLYNQALARQGEVSLGKGESLLRALIEFGFKQLGADRDGLLEAGGRHKDGQKQQPVKAEKDAPGNQAPVDAKPQSKAPADNRVNEDDPANEDDTEIDDDSPGDESVDQPANDDSHDEDVANEAGPAMEESADSDDAFGGDSFYAYDPDDPHAAALHNLLETFKIAKEKQIGDVSQPLRTLAFAIMPELLRHNGDEYGLDRTGTEPLGVIRDVLGPVEELRYIVERMEHWPKRQVSRSSDAWSSFGHRLGEARVAAAQGSAPGGRRRAPGPKAKEAQVAVNPEYGKLEPRVLTLVLAELKQHLEKGKLGNYHMFEWRHNSEFWEKQVPEFVRTAQAVYQQNKTSGSTAARCAEYVWDIDQHDAAMEMFLAAEHDGILEFKDKQKFFHSNFIPRIADFLMLLEPMIRSEPNAIDARCWLMKAYFQAKKPAELQRLVEQTEQHFHVDGRWTEKNIRPFAEACLECQLFDRAAKYLRESLALRRRMKTESRDEIGALSHEYWKLSRAEAALGNTKAAVDAAAAAIVYCPPRKYERDVAVENLQKSIAGAKDLDAFVETLDAEARRTGQDSPLVRKAVGQSYQKREKYPQAIAQYKIACELQPNDKESWQLLMICCDASQEPDEGTKVLLRRIEVDRHNLDLYKQLIQKYAGNESETERAATSVVEADPSEAENHRWLADYRQQQDRWSDAIQEWTQVAELRRLEPTGLLGLAAAQAHQQQWEPLRKTLGTLETTHWPARFKADLQRVDLLREQLHK